MVLARVYLATRKIHQVQKHGGLVLIVTIPSRLDPRCVMLVIELVEEFHQQCLVLYLQIYDTQSIVLFGFAHHIPSG